MAEFVIVGKRAINLDQVLKIYLEGRFVELTYAIHISPSDGFATEVLDAEESKDIKRYLSLHKKLRWGAPVEFNINYGNELIQQELE